MRRGLMALPAMCLAAHVAAAQGGGAALTLHEAEQRALASHPAIQAAQDLAEAANQAIHETRAAYLPTVSAGMTGAQAEPGSRIAAGGLNNPIILPRFATGVAVGQLVTDFGRTKALVQSSVLRADTQRLTADSRRADVLLQVDRAYFTALRTQAVQKIADDVVQERQLVVDQVSALAASGLRSSLDLSFARVNLSEAQLQQVQAQNDVQAAFAVLSTAMGASDMATYALLEEPLPPAPPDDSAPLVQQALRDRPDLAAERFAGQAALKVADAENATWLPTVSAVGAFGVSPYRTDVLNNHYAAAGITLTMPVTTGGLYVARRAEATLRANAEEQRLHELENNVARDVRTAWLDTRAGFLRVGLADQLRTQAADAAELAQARYDVGLGSIVELSQAQLAKARAEIEAATARYDYQVRLAMLKYQTGELK
jgi:outer membrane protein